MCIDFPTEKKHTEFKELDQQIRLVLANLMVVLFMVVGSGECLNLMAAHRLIVVGDDHDDGNGNAWW